MAAPILKCILYDRRTNLFYWNNVGRWMCVRVLLKSQGKNTAEKKQRKKIKNENSYKAKLHGNKHCWARSWSVNISESNTFVRKIRNRGYCLKCYWPIAIHTLTRTIPNTFAQKISTALTHAHARTAIVTIRKSISVYMNSVIFFVAAAADERTHFVDSLPFCFVAVAVAIVVAVVSFSFLFFFFCLLQFLIIIS